MIETEFTAKQRASLLQLARASLEHRLLGEAKPNQPNKPGNHNDPELLGKRAVFVTLTIGGKLRGCIGNLVAIAPLWQSVHDNAIGAAFHDHRFDSLTVKELEQINIEVSILSPPETLAYHCGSDLVSKLRPGIDGVILRKDGRSATFLPQVWGQLVTPELFLDQLCVKAGLPQNSWSSDDISIKTYQVECFSESEL